MADFEISKGFSSLQSLEIRIANIDAPYYIIVDKENRVNLANAESFSLILEVQHEAVKNMYQFNILCIFVATLVKKR